MSAYFSDATHAAVFFRSIQDISIILVVLLLFAISVKYWRNPVDAFLQQFYYRKYNDRFRELIHFNVHSNKDLYRMDTQYIELPLDEFRKLNLKNRYVRNVLSEVIWELNTEYPGEKKKLLRKLYRDLDLELYLLAELNISSTRQLTRSLHHLLDLEVEVDPKRLKFLLAHKDFAVRRKTMQYIQLKRTNKEKEHMMF